MYIIEIMFRICIFYNIAFRISFDKRNEMNWLDIDIIIDIVYERKL